MQPIECMNYAELPTLNCYATDDCEIHLNCFFVGNLFIWVQNCFVYVFVLRMTLNIIFIWVDILSLGFHAQNITAALCSNPHVGASSVAKLINESNFSCLSLGIGSYFRVIVRVVNHPHDAMCPTKSRMLKGAAVWHNPRYYIEYAYRGNHNSQSTRAFKPE